MIVIVDCGAGNIASILNMLKKIGHTAKISSAAEEIEAATKLILPGVGAFDHGMEQLHKSGIKNLIVEKALQGIPLLGICLGAQLLGNKSEEGNLPGLGLMDMDIVKFTFEDSNHTIKIPHMGWSELTVKKPHPLFNNMSSAMRFYFVHSYHFKPKKAEDTLATTFYGYEFASAIAHKNIMGVQFHPEKSHTFGMRLLENFVSF